MEEKKTEQEKKVSEESKQQENAEATPQVEKKEIRISGEQNSKHAMYLIKEFLLKNDYVDIIAGTMGSPSSVRASESLVRLGYVTYEKVKTDTTLLNGKRRTKLIIRLRKTDNFKALYDENEEIKKKTQEIDNLI